MSLAPGATKPREGTMYIDPHFALSLMYLIYTATRAIAFCNCSSAFASRRCSAASLSWFALVTSAWRDSTPAYDRRLLLPRISDWARHSQLLELGLHWDTARCVAQGHTPTIFLQTFYLSIFLSSKSCLLICL